MTNHETATVVDRLWNAEVTARPAQVVRCRTAGEVQTALAAADEAGLPVSVLGGGHDWAGRAVRDRGLVIDLAPMRDVDIRADHVAVVGGGTTTADLLDAARPHGLAATLGTVGSVGVVGVLLGGGLSPLSGVTGLGADNLVAAEVVLADGRVVRTDAAHEPELLWALRGGGGNFGVVTQVELRLHPHAEVHAGMITFPWSQARAVLTGWHDVTTVDDALDVMFGVQAGPDGLVLFAAPTWLGAGDEASSHLDRVRALGTPVLDEVGPVALADTVHALDALFPAGGHYHLSTRTLGGLDATAVTAFLAAADAMPGTCLLNVHHVHGAALTAGLDDAAYAYRDEHLVVEILGVWRARATETLNGTGFRTPSVCSGRTPSRAAGRTSCARTTRAPTTRTGPTRHACSPPSSGTTRAAGSQPQPCRAESSRPAVRRSLATIPRRRRRLRSAGHRPPRGADRSLAAA